MGFNTTPDFLQDTRSQFPILDRCVNSHPLTYLDNGATSLVPKAVIEAITQFETYHRSNVHRGVHTLSQESTTQYEACRTALAEFMGAQSSEQIVHTSGTTASINLVAQTWGQTHIKKNDTIVISEMEHHSNIVPWQILAMNRGADIKVAPVQENGTLNMESLRTLLEMSPKLLAVNHVSNVLGTINPIAEIVQMAHENGTTVLVDGAQAAPHIPLNMPPLEADFYTISGHKMFAPTGTGALYAKQELLQEMPPWQGGGDMIKSVSFAGSTWADAPYRFEAGTPNISGFIGFKAAIDFLSAQDRAKLAAHEHELLVHATEELTAIDGLRIIGTAPHKIAVISFVMNGISSQDIGTLLDMSGVAVRTGHHCAEPLMQALNIESTTRASFAFYNSHTDIERLAKSLNKISRMLA